MMHEIVYWLYMTNLVLLITHELQGTYVKEWYYFNPPKKYSDKTLADFYIYAHIPFFFVLFIGMVKLSNNAGLAYSVIISAFMIFHFFMHISVIKQGKTEFKNKASMTILLASLIVSLVQLPLTIFLII